MKRRNDNHSPGLALSQKGEGRSFRILVTSYPTRFVPRLVVSYPRVWLFYTQGKNLFIRFTARAFRKLLSIFVFSYFHFGFEGRVRDLIVSVPDHCLFFTLLILYSKVANFVVWLGRFLSILQCIQPK